MWSKNSTCFCNRLQVHIYDLTLHLMHVDLHSNMWMEVWVSHWATFTWLDLLSISFTLIYIKCFATQLKVTILVWDVTRRTYVCSYNSCMVALMKFGDDINCMFHFSKDFQDQNFWHETIMSLLYSQWFWSHPGPDVNPDVMRICHCKACVNMWHGSKGLVTKIELGLTQLEITV